MDIKVWRKDQLRYARIRFAHLLGREVYNITSSNQHQFTWFRTAKVGTRSILNALKAKVEFDINDTLVHYSPEAHQDKFKFAFIRNPWDRIVSCYADKVKKELLYQPCWGKDFDYFVNWVSEKEMKYTDMHIRPLHHLFPVDDIDYLARFENFAKEYDYILNQKLGLDCVMIWRNKSKRTDFRDYYTDALVDLVGQIYKEDIALGDYTFN